MKSRLTLLATGCWALLLVMCSALPGLAVELAAPFTSHMVLQREMPLPVWGHATPGAEVTVQFADQIVQVRANPRGSWRAVLRAMPASDKPQVLRATDEQGAIELTDVLVGEVWLCAGQSNMEWPLSGDAFAAQEIPAAAQPLLRLFDFRPATRGVFGSPFNEGQLRHLSPADYFSGKWEACTPETARSFSAIGYYFGKQLHKELEVPVGIIHCAVGGSPTEAWISRDALAGNQASADLQSLVQGNWLDNPRLGEWCRQRGRENVGVAFSTGRMPAATFDGAGPNHPFKPGFLYSSAIEPLCPFAVRGFLWYQGESNAQEEWRLKQHEDLLRLLVNSWREAWQTDDTNADKLPFLYCQLSSIGTEKGYPAQYWPAFRDSQRRLLADLAPAAMAVTSDLGHPSDVHPRNKRDVGARLVAAALGTVYDRNVVYSGPMVRAVHRNGTQLRVEFDHIAGGLKTAADKPPAGFEIAGADGRYLPADVQLQRDSVLVWHPSLKEPVTVRYGWQPYSLGNLINSAGLPASTFEMSLQENEKRSEKASAPE